jgi:hypothetical protein
MQEQIASLLMDLCRRRPELRQQDIALGAHISQATVSRAMHGLLRRPTAARTCLFRYIHDELTAPNHSDESRKQVVTAFEDVWDGSAAHATAIAKIIGASKGLRPVAGKGRRSGE